MSSYDQHMKHWKNHRKDRFVQQCSGYGGGDGGGYAISEERETENSVASIRQIAEETTSYPIFLVQDAIGCWRSYDRDRMSAVTIGSREELAQFAKEYAGDNL